MTTRRRAADPTGPRSVRRRVTVLAVTALLAPATVSAAPGAAPLRARTGVLAEGTALTWTGTTGIRLTVPRQTQLPFYGARLTLRGGTYAIVRWSEDRACAKPPCQLTGWLDLHRDMPPVGGEKAAAAGVGHLAAVGSALAAGALNVYLLTDGQATLRFDGTDLPRGGRHYTPTGRIAASFTSLPEGCAAVGTCDRLRLGGIRVDVGKLGGVDFVVGIFDRAAPPVWQYPQPRYLRGCLYAAGKPTEPSAHPYGCDVTPDGTDTRETESGAAHGWTVLPLYNGYARGDALHRTSGPVYVGYQAATAHDLADSVYVAYAVAITYGIR